MSINDNLFFSKGFGILEDRCHEGISIVRYSDDNYSIYAWAENWDDTWSWTAPITLEELVLLRSVPSNALTVARKILESERTWYITPPSTVPKKPYSKTGYLSRDDGFMDGGTGGRW
jgi:hypothetical protein